ncbi:MAG: ribosome-associated translation inhibitor RaiA [Candidatus Neptunochlamydia sp.]|nr:ribosome-associated translation inhibitor RaiA [Candidatus Neptunochlamydia sp.]
MTKSSQKFDDQEYTISVVGKNIEITKPIRGYLEEKIAKIEALSIDIIDVKVRLDVQKLNHIVDIFLKFSHFRVNVRAITENMYSAIDKSFDKLYTKLRKWKSRIQDHHNKGVAVTEMEVNVLEHAQHEIEESNQGIIDANNDDLQKDYALPKVVKKKKRSLKTLTIDEAMMKMELSNDNFKVYRSEEDQALKVIYRRRDGSYGVISPE